MIQNKILGKFKSPMKNTSMAKYWENKKLLTKCTRYTFKRSAVATPLKKLGTFYRKFCWVFFFNLLSRLAFNLMVYLNLTALKRFKSDELAQG